MSTVEDTAPDSPDTVHVDPRDGDPEVTPELVARHGLSEEEYERIRRILGRDATFTELGIFSAMWSERCGQKNSKRLLRLLPTEAPWVLQGPGGNAGIIDVGGGYALAFKVTSNNHSAAVEAHQGAVTGLGGILRDILSMGARPAALLDSLRFGDMDSGRAHDLFSRVVAGVGDYGKGVGIPNIGGETVFDRGYDGNPLVNTMCLGLMKSEELMTASAPGVGNTLMAVGARTGRDGIRGVAFASEELNEDSDAASRPQAQVGDPSTGKLLLEASLELIASGAITGIQDMGVAGITSGTSEMVSRAGRGVEIEMADVPVREGGMTPYEILLSESQERMLVVAEKGKEEVVRGILEKWKLEAAAIGRVTGDGRFRVTEKGVTVADIPALPLTDGCPTYEREGVEDAEVQALRTRDLSSYAEPTGDLSEAFLKLLGSPNVASKQWVYRQYDTTARASTAVRPGGDSGVVHIPGTNRAVAATMDCNGRFVHLEPRTGAIMAVAEAARNLVCVGALPTAITHCLNFGSPLNPHVYHQFRESILGVAEACKAFETPVTGGDVSFHNETDGTAVYPTPVIGMVGIIEDVAHLTHHAFQSEGDAVILLGHNTDELGGSEYLYSLHDVVAGTPPAVDLLAERRLQSAVLAMIQSGKVRSAHDCADGGLACALAESCLGHGETLFGAEIQLDDPLPPVPVLFGEAPGRIVLSCAAEDAEGLLAQARDYGVTAQRIGTVGPERGTLDIRATNGSVSASTEEMVDAYFGAIPNIMDAPQTAGA